MRPIVLLACLASVAHAAPTRYTRTQDLKIEVRAEKPKPPPVHEQARPAITATQALEIEGLKSEYRGQQEAILKQLIAETPDSEADEKAGYYFMLGELYAKQQRYWRLHSIETGAAKDAQTAKSYLLQAVKTYDALAKNPAFRNFPRMDVALFYYGYTLESGGYVDEARKVFDKLLTDYPSSKFVPEAHFAFGEYYFEHDQLGDAESRYRKVLQFPKASIYWHALYKLGWIYLNQQKPQQALETFFQIAHGAKQDLLVRAARKDFVRAYAEIGKADKARAAFERLDATSALASLEHLADLYLEQGKSDKAIYVYRELMTLAPKHARACAWQGNIVQATMGLPSVADKIREALNLVRLAQALKTDKECRENAAATAGELARAYHSEAFKTKDLATYDHAERLYRAYLAAFPEAADHAELEYFHAELAWARADLETEARKKTALWEAAADAFMEVVRRGKVDAGKIRLSAQAAVLAWKNALDIDPRPSKQADLSDEKAYDKIPPELPIPPREQKMIEAFELYITHVDPKDDERVGMKFLEANTYRRYNHFAQAVPLYADILAHHRTHETAEFAAQLLLDTYNRMQRYDDLVALANQLAADHAFLDGKDRLATVLHGIRRLWLRKQAEQLEKEAEATKQLAKYVAAGEAYLAIYDLDPEAADNDQVLYDALVCYQNGKSIGAATVVYGKLQQYYAKSPLYARATARIGKAYGDIAFYSKAVDRLEEYAKKYAGEEDAYRALSDAVFYAKGAGDDAKAIADTRYFVRMFGARRPQDAANAMFSLTSIYEKQGNGDAVIAHLRDYLRQFGAKDTADRRVIAWAKIGLLLWHQSCPVAEVDGSCVQVTRQRAIRGDSHRTQTQCGPASKTKVTVIARDARKLQAATEAFAAARREYTHGAASPEAKHFYAQVLFAEADRDFEGYLAIAFPANLEFQGALARKSQQRFTEWLERRKKAGGAAKARYDAVLAVKDNASSIAAAARIAQIAQNLSDALFTAEIPVSVRTGPYAEDKVEAFCDRLTEIGLPLADAAVTAYGECLGQSTRLGWFSEWSKMCERELGQIRPESYPTATELRAAPNLTAAIVASEPPTSL